MSARYTLSLRSGRPAVLGANEFFPERSGMESSHATVIIGGVQESGSRPGEAIERFMLEHGDLVKVVFPTKGCFKLRQFAQDIFNRLNRYAQVTLVGISGGAKLAQEVLRLARHAKRNMDNFHLVLDSAPATIFTLAPGLRLPTIASLVIPTCLLLRGRRFSWWFYGMMNGAKPDVLPPHADTLSDEELEALKQHHTLTNVRPPGSFVRETRALVAWMRRPDPQTLWGIRAVFIRSENDELVLGRAFGAWYKAFEGGPLLRSLSVKSAAHADHLSYPKEWLAAYQETFKMLRIAPLAKAPF